jgi:hypothetical protein
MSSSGRTAQDFSISPSSLSHPLPEPALDPTKRSTLPTKHMARPERKGIAFIAALSS